MIVPSVPSSHTSANVKSFIYEIVESAPLPVIDMSRSICSVYFSEHFGKTWTSLVKQHQSLILISQLLWHILLSFDFAFLSLQITFAHLSMCDLLHWDRRCYGVAASLLWMHWVLTLDAITPVIKN